MVYKALGSDGFMSFDGDGGKFRLGCWRRQAHRLWVQALGVWVVQGFRD